MISTVRSVSVPTLVIHGAEDRVVNVRNAHSADVLAVERKVVVVPDGDHNLTREGDLRLLRTKFHPGFLLMPTPEGNGLNRDEHASQRQNTAKAQRSVDHAFRGDIHRYNGRFGEVFPRK